MSDLSLTEVWAFNEALVAFAAAGIPIDLGDSDRSVVMTVTQIDASVAKEFALGKSVQAALAEDHELPARYRQAVLTGIETNQMSLALDDLSRQPIAQEDLRKTVGLALVQPLVLLVLAYCGFIVLCLRFAPVIADIYIQLREPPSWGVRLFTLCREWMPVWVPLVPVLIAAAVYLCVRRSRYRGFRLPGSGRYLATIGYAIFAEQIANRIDSEAANSASEEIAGDRTIAEADRTSNLTGSPLAFVDRQSLADLPPFLRWALTSELDRDSRSRVLRFAAETYRQSAERQSAWWHVLLPTIIGALLGGLIVLAYALAMFGTYITLLYDLAY